MALDPKLLASYLAMIQAKKLRDEQEKKDAQAKTPFPNFNSLAWAQMLANKKQEPPKKNSLDPKLLAYLGDKNNPINLPPVTVTAEAPDWLKSKRKYEQQYSKDWFIDNMMPNFSRSMGISANNMHPNNVAQYEKLINDKVAKDIWDKKKFDGKQKYANWYFSLSDKEREILKKSDYLHNDDFKNIVGSFKGELASWFYDTNKVLEPIKDFAQYYKTRTNGQMSASEIEFRKNFAKKVLYSYPESIGDYANLAKASQNPDYDAKRDGLYFSKLGQDNLRAALIRKYLGVPEPKGYWNEGDSDFITESKYKPTQAKTASGKYYDFSPRILNDMLSKGDVSFNDLYNKYGGSKSQLSRTTDFDGYNKADADAKSLYELQRRSDNMPFSQLGTFTIGAGQDNNGRYISYYDLWDLNPKVSEKYVDLNQYNYPFEVYGRLYEKDFKKK